MSGCSDVKSLTIGGYRLVEPAMDHCPVLCDRLLKCLDYSRNGIVVDATVGQAGHALAITSRLGREGILVGLDVDSDSLQAARDRLKEACCRVEMIRENFGNLHVVLGELGLEGVDIILADLGVSSAQLAQEERGFSFQLDGPLDMRMDNRCKEKAEDLVNTLSQEKLAEIIWRYGQERHSRRIARAIVSARKNRPLNKTGQLVTVISQALGIIGKGRKSRIHPATRTFQALRIAVNDELGNLDRLLKMAPRLLNRRGQIAVISFHSLEDRMVKNNFKENQKKGVYEILTPKPIRPDEEEKRRNPRSRSAKLRVAKRL